MNGEIMSIETIKKLWDFEILKTFVKKEIENETYISTDGLKKIIEILEDKGEENNE